jgi:hypothetical protein
MVPVQLGLLLVGRRSMEVLPFSKHLATRGRPCAAHLHFLN